MAEPVTTHTLGPTLDDLAKCVHCGMCLQNCPTYLETGLETESPRGRLYLMRAKAEGRIETTTSFMGHMELCLLCRNCEAVCPPACPSDGLCRRSGPRYWRSAASRAGASAPLAGVPTDHAPPRTVAATSRTAALLPTFRVARAHATLRPVAAVPRLPGADGRHAAPLSSRFFALTPEIVPAQGEQVARVALFSGCVMPYLYADVTRLPYGCCPATAARWRCRRHRCAAVRCTSIAASRRGRWP